MGGTQSSEQGRYGFHVLKVKENSPAYHAGIDQFFDYIIGINGVSVDNGDSQTLLQVLNESEGKPIPIEIYSSKDQSIREVILTPSREWCKNTPGENSSIGCSIRYCSYDRAGEHVWHILEVAPNSPAEMAGIIPHTDFIIGSPHTVLNSEDSFYDLVEDHIGKPLRIYLYNTEWDSCREAIIVPNNDWGGQGSLGCDVGYGLLHRIPRKSTTSDRPSEDNRQDHTRDQQQQPQHQVYSDVIFSSTEIEEQPPPPRSTSSQQQDIAASPLTSSNIRTERVQQEEEEGVKEDKNKNETHDDNSNSNHDNDDLVTTEQ
ncbi:GRASP55/65 PDZ-like domain-containing protein [Phascolomyces articulosus]|uniref:GRASP55/65 PDZ-like domain-containing protein n=1 Tax=Phascolomyces articulosus TaxID=60185 RepID=A0AAD5KQX9_9FUNG|nr:GRASP55/65 PDZ-like domain-containing protein [Phascolomyces articulosus]